MAAWSVTNAADHVTTLSTSRLANGRDAHSAHRAGLPILIHMHIALRTPSRLTVVPLHVGMAFALAACAGDAATRVSAPDVAGVAQFSITRVERDGETATNAGSVITAEMGVVTTNVARIRVVNEDGMGQAGIVVHFRIARGAATIERNMDTTDATGEADGGAIVVASADTAMVRAELRVSTESGTHRAAELNVDILARRDLDHFGGPGVARFEQLPISRALLSHILPLGTMASADAALPSADALLVPLSWQDGQRLDAPAVRAMSDGLVVAIDSALGAITLRVRDQVQVRYAGVRLRRDLWVGRVVRSGETLGMLDANTQLPGLAVRVLDGDVTRKGWMRPERYGTLRNSAFFARYLVDSARSTAFALVRRAAPDLDGRTDYDLPGRLIGSWFAAQAPLSSREADPLPALALNALTFAYDAERPGQVRVAIGRQLANALGISGVYGIAWEDTDPATVGVDAGVASYRLFATDDESRVGRSLGVLVVQLTGDGVVVGLARDGETPRLSSASLRLSR